MLTFYFLNVGNGDSIVIEYIPKNSEPVFGLIDCNAAGQTNSPALKKLQTLGAKELSFVCITHPDKDHYSGIHDVLTHFTGRIAEFYTFPIGDIASNPNRIKKLANSYARLVERQDDPSLTRKAMEFIQILRFADENFRPSGRWHELTGPMNQIAPPGFAGVKLYCLLPQRAVKGPFFQSIERGQITAEREVEHNPLSLAFLIRFGNSSIILGGDACAKNWFEHRRWQRNRDEGISADVVKLPHHGSEKDCDPDTIDNLFDASGDKIAVISADGKRHPDGSVLEDLLKKRIRPYCTNVFHGWGNSVTQLLIDKEIDQELVRYLNELARSDLGLIQPCKGEIKIIADGKQVRVLTEFTHDCLCDPGLNELFAEAI